MDVMEALAGEYAALERVLDSLDEESWAAPSLCEGWTVADVVLHLAQTEEMAAASLRSEAESAAAARTTGDAPGARASAGAAPSEIMNAWSRPAETVDDAAEQAVVAERSQPAAQRLSRWKVAHKAVFDALSSADPGAQFRWATVPLKPKTLATTRLSEHWIHANDIAKPLGIDYPDTRRLWHIARLAQRTVPYAYMRAARDDPPSVRLELTSPDGDTWTLGEPDSECVISGLASEVCRIAARRLAPAEASSVTTTGERAVEVLELIRTYA